MQDNVKEFLVKKHTLEFFKQDEIIDRIQKYADSHFYDSTPVKVSNKNKVFYHYTEWSGWRFWKKAIFSLDFPSIKSQIKSMFK